ncbi:MAG: hypothetical protein IT320_07370 [Anaerolineae bacterium]|nr:hypothetical protein [Anaerolineae bacterium]
MNYRSIELGINAIQAGNLDEGARLLRIAVKSGDLAPELRAVAYLWLAETQSDPQHKRACYNEALIADPGNQEAQVRLTRLLAAQLPPMPDTLPEETPPEPVPVMRTQQVQLPPPPPYNPQPAAPYTTNIAEHIVGVYNGPNGPGSGFFIAPQMGLLATTRFVTGGMERMTIELQPGRQLPGYVVRSFPDVDLALIRVEYGPGTTLPVTPLPRVPDNAPLLVAPYQRPIASGTQRATKRALAAHWVPTDFTAWEDVGGAPLFDSNYYLVGMATQNTARNSGHYFVLHIAAIRARADAYLAEAQAESRAYCPTCGSGSKAGVMGFFYCETCGGVMPTARHVQRFQVPQAEALYETSRIRCTRCGAQVGFHGGRCLRCGQPPETRPL